mmetsp:Transcript_15485/g.10854  ORF Transcript_15485/g.10854 Transcript_15485/m.10854 type:complete len:207 (+) Transcript_15485:3-623(+)
MLDFPTLPFIEAGAGHTQGLLVDPACTGQDCFSVEDIYYNDQTGTQGFTVFDTQAPGYSGPTAVSHTTGLYVDSACTGQDCFSVTNTFDGNPMNPNGTEGFSVFDYNAPNYSGPPQVYMSLAPPQAAVEVTPAQAEASQTNSKANPSHFLLCGHAMLLGALSATVTKLTKEDKASWSEVFERESKEAAAAVTPVGSHLMSTHVFGK